MPRTPNQKNRFVEIYFRDKRFPDRYGLLVFRILQQRNEKQLRNSRMQAAGSSQSASHTWATAAQYFDENIHCLHSVSDGSLSSVQLVFLHKVTDLKYCIGRMLLSATCICQGQTVRESRLC